MCASNRAVPGLTTLPTLAAVYLLGLNPVICQTVNLLCTPLNFATVILFAQLGGWAVGVEVSLSMSELTAALSESLVGGLSMFVYPLLACKH